MTSPRASSTTYGVTSGDDVTSGVTIHHGVTVHDATRRGVTTDSDCRHSNPLLGTAADERLFYVTWCSNDGLPRFYNTQ